MAVDARNEKPRRADRAVVNGLLHEEATPLWQARYEFESWRYPATGRAVVRILKRAPGGRGPERLRDRPPHWLPALVTGLLEEAATEHSFHGGFRFVRVMERHQLLEVPHDDLWVAAGIGALGGNQATASDVRGSLDRDPELLEELIPRLFEVEGNSVISLATLDSFRRHPWRGAILGLVADGVLDRDLVLDGCLTALTRDFSRYRSQWFTATWQALAPTVAERSTRWQLLLPVLGSSVPPVVSFGVRELAAIQKHGVLDPLVTLPALEPAVHAKAKGTALTALRIGADLSAGEPGEGAGRLARGALMHPHPDVQLAAARLLESLGEGDTASGAHSLSPTVREQLGIVTTSEPERAPAPVRFEPRPPVPPPDGAPGVVELAAALLEGAPDPLEVEALLGALATGRGAQAIASLAKRARSVVRREDDGGLGPAGLPGQVARLVLAAAQVEPPPLPSIRTPTPCLLHLQARFAEVAEVLAGRRAPAPLLATPDLPGGLVSPTGLLERLARRREIPAEDLMAALLRLDTAGRADALAALPASSAPWNGPVRHALGDHDAAAGPGVLGKVAALARSPLDGPASRARLVRWTVDVDGDPYQEFGVQVTRCPAGPTCLRAPKYGPDVADWWGLLALVLPHDGEHFAALGFHEPFRATQHAGNYRDAVRVLDELAAHPGRHGPLSAAVLAAGLAAARADQRVHAVDALVELTTSGRLTPIQVGDALVEHAAVLPPPRWAESLAAAGVVTGPGVPVDVLTRLLPTLPHDLRGLHAPLGVLLEETSRAGGRLEHPGLRDWLCGITGSSKAATTARRLLAR